MPACPATLITGAADRIGKAMAIDLAKTGTPVCIHYNRSESAAHDLAQMIRETGGSAATVQADLLNDGDVAGLVAQASAVIGAPIQCLVNNASLFEADGVGDLSPGLFAKHFAIHATAPALLADQMVEGLPKGSEGLIVNIIDQRVWALTPNFISYTASKTALWGLTQTLAQAYAKSTQGRVRVNAIGPGPTLANQRQDPAEFQKQVDAVPLGRGPALDEFAATISYLWAMKSLTGQMIALDGGQHLAWETPDVAGIIE
jgi:NAD(P)-dependent dehydrogenase (short-subunit alcohol dehydrogenase family)